MDGQMCHGGGRVLGKSLMCSRPEQKKPASVRADTARSALERLRAQHVRVDLFHVSGLLRGVSWRQALQLRSDAEDEGLQPNVVFDTACHFGASPSAWPRGLRLIGAQMDLLALNKALAVASWTCSLALLCLGMLETQGGRGVKRIASTITSPPTAQHVFEVFESSLLQTGGLIFQV
ncbi:unnamed protein product [Durusdinium trenchii]|uniref:Uncharacterized protein n=1 Tax=Durusdinium trenchii TaxID=1381693 RepID=A0ABP0MZC3_9DINO